VVIYWHKAIKKSQAILMSDVRLLNLLLIADAWFRDLSFYSVLDLFKAVFYCYL